MLALIIKGAADLQTQAITALQGCRSAVSRASAFSRKAGHPDFNVKSFRFLAVGNWFKMFFAHYRVQAKHVVALYGVGTQRWNSLWPRSFVFPACSPPSGLAPPGRLRGESRAQGWAMWEQEREVAAC